MSGLAVLWALFAAPAAQAQDVARLGDDAMPGVIRTGSAAPLAKGLALSVASGYGFTGAALEQGDSHHRGAARLATAFGLTPQLGLALRLDGRYDRHFGDLGNDDGWVGDPRLVARYRRSVGAQLHAGLQVGLWAPGAEAPSIELGALSVEAIAASTWEPAVLPLRLSVNAGYRIDRSAASVAGSERLSLADRMSLGASDYNAMLFAVGGSYQIGAVEILGEWSLDLLHGNGAPGFRESPMRLGLGGRVALGGSLDAFAQTELSLSKVVASDVQDMLLPIEPQASLLAGVHYRWEDKADEPLPVVEVVPPPPEAVTTAALRGRILSGDEGIAKATVILRDRDGKEHQVQSAEDGSFVFDGLRSGRASISIRAEGFDTREQSLTLSTDAEELVVRLEVALPPGQLRGVVRSFRGKPLEAELTIQPMLMTVQTAADGSFEVDLPPGEYEVTVTVERYEQQTRAIHIDEDGVTIMNVDLRR